MKNKFISGLLWIIAFSVVLQSCRNDYLADQQEAHSNSSQFQYTSKRISLAESKHKTKLLPEIEQVENGLRESMNNTLGKTINYGNGVSIDTDEVIYIEKASGFHTYTFNIKRENEAPTAPLQNLVLSPLPDGSYRELLITYYLTAQEKQTLLSGKQIDTKGKLSVLELEQGTFNQGNQIQGAINCSWVEETVFQCCSEGVHDQSNFNKWLECKAEIPPKVFTIVTHKCTAVPATTALGNDGEGGGSGGGLGSGNDDDDIPTQPNLPLPNKNNDPCKTTKNILLNSNIQAKLAELKTQSTLGGEKAFMVKQDGTTSPIIQGGDHETSLGDITGYSGFYHNHTPKGINMFSPKDIYELFDFIFKQPPGTPVNSSFGGMIDTEPCASCLPDGLEYYHYIVRFNGPEYVATNIRQTVYDFETLRKNYKDFEMNKRNQSGYSSPNGNYISFKGLEEVFFNTLDDMGIDKNMMILQRVDQDGIVYNITLDSNGKPQPTPCP